MREGRRRTEANTSVTLQCLLVQNYGSSHMNSCSHSPDFNSLLCLKMPNPFRIFLAQLRSYLRNYFTILTKCMQSRSCISVREIPFIPQGWKVPLRTFALKFCIQYSFEIFILLVLFEYFHFVRGLLHYISDINISSSSK